MASHGHSDGHGHDAHHPTPITYYKVFAFLMVFLVITLAAAAVDLGPFNLPIAMAIAVAKAAAVVLVFMHVKYGTPLIKVFSVAAFFWLVIMFGFTLTDYISRAWLG